MNKTDLVNANTGDMVLELCRRLDAPPKIEVSRIYLGVLQMPVWALSKPQSYIFSESRRVYLTPSTNTCRDRVFVMAGVVLNSLDHTICVDISRCSGGDNSWSTLETVQINPSLSANLPALMGKICAAVFTIDGRRVEVWF